MDMEDVRDRASAALESVRENPIVQRIESFRYDPPPLDWKAILVVILTVVGAYYFGRWNAADDRDQWWREQIAAKSSSVRSVIQQSSAEIDALDKEILKALGDTHEKLSAAERQLEKVRGSIGPDGCPRIPAFCVRN